MSTDKTYELRRLGALAGWVRWAILAMIAVELAMVLALGWQYAVLDRIGHWGFRNTEEMLSTASLSDTVVTVLGILVAVTVLVNVVVFLIWTYRTNANAQALTKSDLSCGPGEAVGSLFVPFVNLVVPALNYSEVWRASRDPAAWREQSTPWLVPVWWVGNIVIGIWGLLLNLTGDPGTAIPALMSYTVLRIAYFATSAVVRLLQFVVVTRISRLQEAHVTAA